MGQKVPSTSLRLQRTNRHFDSCWYTDFFYSHVISREFALRNFLNSMLRQAGRYNAHFSVLNLPKRLIVNLFWHGPLKLQQARRGLQPLQKLKRRKRPILNLLSPLNRYERPCCYATRTVVQTPKKRLQPKEFGLRYVLRSNKGVSRLLLHVATQHSKWASSSPAPGVAKGYPQAANLPRTCYEVTKERPTPSGLLAHVASSIINPPSCWSPMVPLREILCTEYKAARTLPATQMERGCANPCGYATEGSHHSTSYVLLLLLLLRSNKRNKANQTSNIVLRTRNHVHKAIHKQTTNKLRLPLPRKRGRIGFYLLQTSRFGGEMASRANPTKTVRPLPPRPPSTWFLRRWGHPVALRLPLAGSPTSTCCYASTLLMVVAQQQKPTTPTHLRYSSHGPPLPPCPKAGWGLLVVVAQQQKPQSKTEPLLQKMRLLRFLLLTALLTESESGVSSKESLLHTLTRSLFLNKRNRPVLTSKIVHSTSQPAFGWGGRVAKLRSATATRSAVSLAADLGLVARYNRLQGRFGGGAATLKQVEVVLPVKTKRIGQPIFFDSRPDYPEYNYLESTLSNKLNSQLVLLPYGCRGGYFQSSLLFAEEMIYYLKRGVTPQKTLRHLLWKVPLTMVRGVRVTYSGCFRGQGKRSQRANTECVKLGETPLNALSSRVDFACKSVLTRSGLVGIKVWICYR